MRKQLGKQQTVTVTLGAGTLSNVKIRCRKLHDKMQVLWS
jgi:hypothetical protein